QLRLDASRIPTKFSKIVELGTPYFSTADQLDLDDQRGIFRPHTLDADAMRARHLADRERSPASATLTMDAHPFEDLKALLATFRDQRVHLHGVARPKRGQILAAVGSFDGFNGGD